jgi:hypothetical protein
MDKNSLVLACGLFISAFQLFLAASCLRKYMKTRKPWIMIVAILLLFFGGLTGAREVGRYYRVKSAAEERAADAVKSFEVAEEALAFEREGNVPRGYSYGPVESDDGSVAHLALAKHAAGTMAVFTVTSISTDDEVEKTFSKICDTRINGWTNLSIQIPKRKAYLTSES